TDAVFDKDDQGGWPFFYRLKKGRAGLPGGFGTPAERANAKQLQAKELAYRYCVFADEFVEPTEGGGITFMTSGKSEVTFHDGGHDFMITLGAWPLPTGVPYGRAEEQAGTFMHELGHALGLLHGGDDVNNKPNDHSIMNYIWQLPKPWMYESQLGMD